MIAQRPGRGDILHDDFDHLLAVLEERAANAFLIRVLSIGLQNSSYQLRSFESQFRLFVSPPQPQPRFFCPPGTLPATRRCVRYPIEAFTKAGKEKRPGVSRAPPCRCATGRPAAARALLQHCRVTGRSHISAMELSVWKVYPAQTSELNEDSRIKVVRPANTPAPQGCVSRSRSSARTAGLFFWGGQSGRR